MSPPTGMEESLLQSVLLKMQVACGKDIWKQIKKAAHKENCYLKILLSFLSSWNTRLASLMWEDTTWMRCLLPDSAYDETQTEGADA